MKKRKLISSAAAAVLAVGMMMNVLCASAVQIGTQTSADTEDPAITQSSDDEPEDPGTHTSEEDPEDPEDPVTEPTQTSETKRTTKKTTSKTTAETTKRTTRQTTTQATTTQQQITESTTTTPEPEVFYSADVEVVNAGVDDDGRLEIRLKIESESKIAGAKIFLDFDKDILKYHSTKVNDSDIGGMATNECDDGRYTFNYVNTSGTDFDGTYVSVFFTFKETKADQTSVMAVVDNLNDEKLHRIKNITIANAIIEIEHEDDDSSDDSSAEHSYQPINLNLSSKDGVTLDSLGIRDYNSITSENEDVAYIKDGKIYMLKAGTSDVIVDYKDGTKGYFRINVINDSDEEASTSDDSSKSAIASTDSDDSRRQTLKITIIIVIVCTAIVLLIVEYFIIMNRQRRKKAEKNKRRGRYNDEDDDDDYDDVSRLSMPADEIAPDDEGYDNDQIYTYPTRNKVNDYADFLSNDEGEDIKFTAPVARKPVETKKNIEDFTLSQGGNINRMDD